MLASRRSLQTQLVKQSLSRVSATNTHLVRRQQQQQQFQGQARKMTTEAKKKYEWLVILPDYPEALSKRMAVRTEHLQNAKKLGSSGVFALGGATLAEQPVPGEGPKINGSVLIAMAESREEVEELIKADVYAKSDVWDLSKVQIHPFVSAVRSAL